MAPVTFRLLVDVYNNSINPLKHVLTATLSPPQEEAVNPSAGSELSIPEGLVSPELTKLVNEMLNRDPAKRPSAKSIMMRPELEPQVRPSREAPGIDESTPS
eukprot:8303516-Pyramimonas_sp.AAC.1